MNKIVLFIAAPVIIIAIAVGSYFLLKKPQTPAVMVQPNGVNTGEIKSLKDLFATSNPQKCTFNDNAGSTGTLYVGNGQLKGEFVAQNGDIALTTNILTPDGQTVYTWTTGKSTGFKMPFSVIENRVNPAGNVAPTIQQPGYKCSDWVVDASVFVIPNVQFTEYKEPVVEEDLSTPEENQPETDCSVCTKLKGEAQEKCYITFSCE